MADIIVWLIVGSAAFFVGRKIVRTLTGRDRGCSCDQDCTGCGENKDNKSCKEGE